MAERRHYCYYCGRKRIETLMIRIYRDTPGRNRWICFVCGNGQNQTFANMKEKRKVREYKAELMPGHSPLESTVKKIIKSKFPELSAGRSPLGMHKNANKRRK